MNITELHAAAWQQLQQRKAQLPHAILLTGQEGIGKFALAKAFVEGLLCEAVQPSGVACGQCEACRWMSHGNHPDLRVVVPEALQLVLLGANESAEPVEKELKELAAEGKTEKKASQEIKIDQIRALDGMLSVGTHRQGLRVILIYPAEAMNRNTANSILKSLEEPPESTLFILVSSNSQQLLPTIRSRCQVVNIAVPRAEVSVQYLSDNGIGGAMAKQSLSLSGNAPFAALALAERFEKGWIQQLIAYLEQGPSLDTFSAAATLEKSLKECKESSAHRHVCEWLQKWTHDLLMAQAHLPVVYFTENARHLERLSSKVSPRALMTYYRKSLLPMRRDADHPLNSRLYLETLFAQYQSLFA